MKAVATLLLFVCCPMVSNVYAGYDEDVAAMNKGMPKSVQLFNKRQIDCNHWSGEEPYDKARLKEINSAITELKCNALNEDKNKLLKKYKTRPDVFDAINKAKEFY